VSASLSVLGTVISEPFIQSVSDSIQKHNANKLNKCNKMEGTTYRKSLESSVSQGLWLENVTKWVKK